MLRQLVVIVAIAACIFNGVAYAYTDDDYECTPTYFTKCKIKDGTEYVMLNSLGEQKYSNIKQTQGMPIVIFPAQLKYEFLLKEARKPKNGKEML